MSEPSGTTPADAPPTRENLHELARLLRQADHLEPETRRELADLLEELAGALGPTSAQDQANHLAESAAHLMKALHERHDAGPLAAAKKRLEDAALRIESKAPVATGLARRLVDLLADLGI